MNIVLAKHYGMCFGVRDALRATHDLASEREVTVLGQLVHNRVVRENLEMLGVRDGALENLESSKTSDVVITAHGAADRDRKAWKSAGYEVTDTTCPLVKKAHSALAVLVKRGYQPVVIGKPGHVEVKGLVGDFPETQVVETFEEIATIPFAEKIGVISQTTQPIAKVRSMVEAVQQQHPTAEVRFMDTVCQPTKDRQIALDELCDQVQVVVVVGGRNSNNTHQLVNTVRGKGRIAHHVETAEDVNPEWFKNVESVGITAGTSTLDESVKGVFERVQAIAAQTKHAFSLPFQKG